MQTDLQVLLAITGAVCGIYMISNVIKRRSKSVFQDDNDLEDYDALPSHKAEQDPLMDENEQTESKAIEQSSQVSEADAIAEQAFGARKKVIIDDAVVGVQTDESLSFPETHEPTMGAETNNNAFVALTVITRQNKLFPGKLLFNALKSNHLYYNAQGVFQRHVNDNPMLDPLYTALSMMEPGTFDIDTMSQQSFPGIVLLMTVPCRQNPLMVFEKMLNSARQLAVTLDGELCDASRQPLTAPMMSRLREKIQQMHRRQLSQSHVTNPV